MARGRTPRSGTGGPTRLASALARASLAVAIGLAGLAVSETVSPAPAGAACAAPTKSLSGTVQGEDGRYVSALVGLVLLTANGTVIGLDGCPKGGPGYAAIDPVNAYPGNPVCCYILPGVGSATTPYHDGVRNWDLTKRFSFSGLPSNAATAWIETYTGRAGGQPNTSTERYGHSLRRPVPLSNNNLHIRQPLNCGLSENGVTGTTGSLVGNVYLDGRLVTPSKVEAFSTSPDGGNTGPIRAFNVVDAHPPGAYRVGSLTPGTYSIFVTAGGLKKRFDGLPVSACQDRETHIAMRGSVPPPPPPDIPPWAAEAIQWLLDNGYATGYPDGTFRGTHPITRAQSARMLHRLAGSPDTGGGCGGLTDVPAWAADAICWLVDDGYATGYPDGTFRPNRNITRAQNGRMLHRIAGSPDPGTGCRGTTDVPTWAADAICWLVNSGHMTGYPDSTFRPNLDITRAQNANVLHNIHG